MYFVQCINQQTEYIKEIVCGNDLFLKLIGVSYEGYSNSNSKRAEKSFS